MDTIPQDNMPRKQCTKCKQWFPLTTEFFYRRGDKEGIWRSACKKCHLLTKEIPPAGTQKQCIECQEFFPATTQYFCRKKGYKDGLNARCKGCLKVYRAAYYAEHQEEENRRDAMYRREHREEERHRSAIYYAMHPEQYSQYHRRYYAEHQEEILEKSKRYYQTERGLLARRVNECNRKVRKRNGKGTHTVEELYQQLQRQKGKCYYCHVKLGKGKNAWHEDHIVPLSRGGSNSIENIVIACPPCNLRKHNKLPHEWVEGGTLL